MRGLPRHFYPRSPCGERRRLRCTPQRSGTDFYPRSPCGERPTQTRHCTARRTISIHALLAESDPQVGLSDLLRCDFYPRSPCGERRRHCRPSCRPIRNFYPRSPCGERQNGLHTNQSKSNFYPRSPCGERRESIQRCIDMMRFLSTLSLRRATGSDQGVSIRYGFLSTLSLRRATAYKRFSVDCKRDFYPRSPCGERPRLPALRAAR